MSEPETEIVTIRRGEDDDEWDAFVASVPGGHHVQTARWAHVKTVVGMRAARLLVHRGGALVAGCQVLIRDLPVGGAVGYVPRGPLLMDRSPAAAHALLPALSGLLAAERVVYLKLQPPADRADLVAVLAEHGFTPSTLDVAPRVTSRVVLAGRPDAELLAGARSTTRRKIRRGLRGDAVVRVGDEDDLAHLQEILDATGHRQGFAPYPLEYHQRMWRAFATGDHVRLLIAELDGRPYAAILVIAFGDTASFKLGGWTGEHQRTAPNELLHWAAMRWARDRGFAWYDLEGFHAAASEALEAGRPLPEHDGGVAFFKLGFGGELEVFPGTMDLALGRVWGPVLARLVPRAQRWRGVAQRLAGRRH